MSTNSSFQRNTYDQSSSASVVQSRSERTSAAASAMAVDGTQRTNLTEVSDLRVFGTTHPKPDHFRLDLKVRTDRDLDTKNLPF